ncbi:MAG: IS1634 family transposase [Candidatus Rokubacteria bacterium]|nr:IS1634 family transposase [Candidatus Rokubacteria bacterium]
MYFFERLVDGRKYRVAAESVWDPRTKQPVSRQVLLGPADPAPVADLARTRTLGTRRVGDIGALGWIAEQLNVVRHLNDALASGPVGPGPSAGELVLAVAVQRACAPGSKRALAAFLAESVPRLSCLPAEKFSGQAFYRVAAGLTEAQLEQAQIAIAREAVARFDLSTDVLAFDSTNFDTHIATTTPGELARRGHAKSKRRDLRVVGLGVLVSETGHVPLLHRTYPGNSSDQAVLASCLEGLGRLHQALDDGEGRTGQAQRTVVRDGGFWSEQLELDLDVVGYHSLISLPLSHSAAEQALASAAGRGRMKPLRGRLKGVRAARLVARVGNLDRTLVVVESQELLRGQKRGIAVALRNAQVALRKLSRRAAAQRSPRDVLATRVQKVLAREHLAEFVVVTIQGSQKRPRLTWRVDAARRRALERTRLGRRVLCTDHTFWSTERIVTAFRGQWNVEELFRRAKKGGLVPWGPSYQWADPSLRLHTFATVLGLMLVALAKLALRTRQSARAMMKELADIKATLARTSTGHQGRRPTVMIPPELSMAQRKAVTTFELARWMPTLSSTM